MPDSITLELFFFNAKEDYLPHFKSLTVDYDLSLKLLDLLMYAKERYKNYQIDTEHPFVKIQNHVVAHDSDIEALVEHFGTTLRVMPLSTYRVTHDLIINNDDFYSNMLPLEPFCDQEDINYYQSLYGLYYASSNFELDNDYCGDALWFLGAHLLEKYPARNDEIMDAILEKSEALFGCEYEKLLWHSQEDTKVINHLKEKAIAHLKKRAIIAKLFSQIKTPKPKIMSDKIDPKALKCTKEQLGEVGYYYGYRNKDASIAKRLNQRSMDLISFDLESRKCGLELLGYDNEKAFKKAAKVLIDAYDNGITCLAIQDNKVFNFLTTYHKQIEKAANRELPLVFVPAEQLKKLL